MQEFAYLCITLQQITPPLGHLIKLPLFGLKTSYTISIHYANRPLCFPVIIKRTCVMLPNVQTETAQPEVKKQRMCL